MVNCNKSNDNLIKFNFNRKKLHPKRVIFIISMIAIPIIHFCIFYIYVNFRSFFMAFQRYDANAEIYWTFENFRLMFDDFKIDGIGTIAIKNTMVYFLIGLFCGNGFGCIFAYFSYKNLWGDTARRVLGAGFGLMAPVVVAILVKQFFNPGGPISNIVTDLFNLSEPAQMFNDDRFANGSLYFYTIWGTLGINLYYRGAMMRIPSEIIEYGKLDGLTWWQELVKVIIPLMWPTVVTMLTIQFTSILTASADVFLYTGGGHGTATLSYWLWSKQFNALPNSNSLNYAAAIGMSMTFITIPIVFFVRWLMSKMQDTETY